MKQGGGRAKGSGFELDVAWFMSQYWWGTPRAIRRTPMSGGWSKTKASGDLISEMDPFPFSVECKFSVSWHFGQLFTPDWSELGDYWEQCVGDASHQNQRPMLVFKTNGSQIYTMLETGYMPFLTPKHNRVFTKDNRGVDVCALSLKDDFLKIPIATVYESAMPEHLLNAYSFVQFQELRKLAQTRFPPNEADTKYLLTLK